MVVRVVLMTDPDDLNTGVLKIGWLAVLNH
jgi:hypothetical protein